MSVEAMGYWRALWAALCGKKLVHPLDFRRVEMNHEAAAMDVERLTLHYSDLKEQHTHENETRRKYEDALREIYLTENTPEMGIDGYLSISLDADRKMRATAAKVLGYPEKREVLLVGLHRELENTYQKKYGKDARIITSADRFLGLNPLWSKIILCGNWHEMPDYLHVLDRVEQFKAMGARVTDDYDRPRRRRGG